MNKNNGVCNKCKAGPRTEEERFQVLYLDVPDTGSVLTLEGLLQDHFSESSDTAYMRCNCCTHKASCPGTGVCKPKPFSSRSILVKSPDTLLIQINRFSNLSGIKLKTTVWPDDIISLPSGDEYELCGIAHHLGDFIDRGHYIASLKHGDGWIRCNDTHISPSTESDTKSLESYVCIYNKIFTSTTSFTPTNDWQNIKGRMVPGGLHYSFGVKGNYAKNMNFLIC